MKRPVAGCSLAHRLRGKDGVRMDADGEKRENFWHQFMVEYKAVGALKCLASRLTLSLVAHGRSALGLGSSLRPEKR